MLVPNGSVTYTEFYLLTGEYAFNTVAMVECVVGYRLHNDVSSTTCLLDGNWTTPIPSCIRGKYISHRHYTPQLNFEYKYSFIS